MYKLEVTDEMESLLNNIIRFALIKFTSTVDHLGLLILVFTGSRYLNVLELPATLAFLALSRSP